MTERCRFCNRKLKDPKSQVAGCGPTCAEKNGLKVRVVTTRIEVGEGSPLPGYPDPGEFF